MVLLKRQLMNYYFEAYESIKKERKIIPSNSVWGMQGSLSRYIVNSVIKEPSSERVLVEYTYKDRFGLCRRSSSPFRTFIDYLDRIE